MPEHESKRSKIGGIIDRYLGWLSVAIILVFAAVLCLAGVK
ncbi:MAG: hypothetical protein O2794_03420 [bacterium]|nr:hypothetical protein [bacterium]